MFDQIYRIYDSIEKRHDTELIVDTRWNIWDSRNQIFDEDPWQTRYIVERSMDEIDKNWLGIFQNDIVIDWEWNWRKRVFFVWYSDGKFFLVWDNEWFEVEWGNVEIIGHVLRDSHLLEG